MRPFLKKLIFTLTLGVPGAILYFCGLLATLFWTLSASSGDLRFSWQALAIFLILLGAFVMGQMMTVTGEVLKRKEIVENNKRDFSIRISCQILAQACTLIWACAVISAILQAMHEHSKTASGFAAVSIPLAIGAWFSHRTAKRLQKKAGQGSETGGSA